MSKLKENNQKNDILNYFKKNNLTEPLSEIIDDNLPNEFFKNIGAIDVGYGNTKYLGGVDKEGNLQYGIFPSVSPLAPNQLMSGGLLGKRDTKIVDIEGTFYEVGIDAELSSNNTDTTKNLNESYIFSEQYKALFLGALAYMGNTHYDCLVLGLPVNYIHNSEKLKDIFKGEHRINDDLTCVIDEILVVPQPLGGFYDIAIGENKFSEFVDETNLVIDPGYLTYDFLLTHGLKPIENRSDALKGGMSRVLNTIAKSISHDLGKPYIDYNSIDRAIRKPKKRKDENGNDIFVRTLKIAGEEIDLTKHIIKSSPTIQNSINHMTNIVQTYDDIDNILLVGGSENVFEKKIREHLKREIYKSKDAIFSNVRGFFFIGVIEFLKRISK